MNALSKTIGYGLVAAALMTGAAAAATETVSDTDKTFFTASDYQRIVSTSRTNDVRFDRDYAGKKFGVRTTFQSAQENPFLKGHYIVSFGQGRMFCSVTDEATLTTIIDWHPGQMTVVRGTIKGTTLGRLELTDCHVKVATATTTR